MDLPGAAFSETFGQPLKCLTVPDGVPPIILHATLAIALFGTDAAWFLMGSIIIQTYNYYLYSKNDHPAFKALVYSTVFIAIAASAIEAEATYAFLVPVWGDPMLSADVSVASNVLGDLQPLLDAVVAIFVQFFFTWRIWNFCMAIYGRKMKLLVACICLFIILTSLCAFAASIALTVLFISPDFTSNSKVTWAVLTWSTSTAVADITITACMTSILFHAKSSFYFGETRDRISRLLRLTIQTGLLTTILAIPVSPLYVFESSTSSFTFTCYLLGKSYVISLLVNLNARHYHPTAITGGHEEDTGQLPTELASGRNRNISGTDPTSGNGVLSSIRSIFLTVHNNLASSRPAA